MKTQTIHKPNMKCTHCGYKWYSYSGAKHKTYIPRCIKCYKKTVTPLNTNIIYYRYEKLTNKTKKIIKKIKTNYTTNTKISNLLEQHHAKIHMIYDILLLSTAIISLTLIIYYFFVKWAP